LIPCLVSGATAAAVFEPRLRCSDRLASCSSRLSQKKGGSAQALIFIFIVILRLVYGLQIWCGFMR